MKAFRERMSLGKKYTEDDKEEPNVTEYGNEEEKVTYYKDGIPEQIGRKRVEELFEGELDCMAVLLHEHQPLRPCLTSKDILFSGFD